MYKFPVKLCYIPHTSISAFLCKKKTTYIHEQVPILTVNFLDFS